MYKVNVQDCNACESCIDVCPSEAITLVDGHAFIDEEECIECAACEAECPDGAIVEV